MSRLKRQSFLGPNCDALLEAATIGIVGLGGGGSHFAQQFAHVGIGGHVLSDGDIIDEFNTNRLVGGTLSDVEEEMPKIDIAQRTIRGLQPNARIVPILDRWQTARDFLKTCDIIVGAVDSVKERDELEGFARRYLIPYIDIGMDVIRLNESEFRIVGQVILSSPGEPCLWCCNVITDKRLHEEAEKYGEAGDRPQVIWPNGVLASTGVGLAIQLITPWFKNPPRFMFLQYDGNKGTVTPNLRVEMLKGRKCSHYPANETGDPLFNIRDYLNTLTVF